MKLKKAQVLYIDNQKYTVINMIEFKQDSWRWQEYEIVSDNNIHKWLSVEENEYYIYEIYNGSDEKNEDFNVYEQGIATVIDYFGNADVDKYETCEYCDYATKDEETIISIEKWEDETEKTIGYYLENERVKIKEETETDNEVIYTKNNNVVRKNMGKVAKTVFLSIMGLLMIMTFLPNWFVNKSVEKYLEKQTTKYTYVTSVTSNIKNQKAKVYESSFSSLDETVKDIIDGVPEGITETIDADPNTEEDGIGLQTKNEYAYIYKENGKIYVQVSSKEYVRNSGSTYHSRYYHHYYNGFNSTRRSTIYSSYASSARQRSVNSRVSSGGGTSSGK